MNTTNQDLAETLPTESVPTRDREAPPQEESLTLGEVFREMVSELVECRELLLQLTLRDIRIRYKQAVMGFG